MHCVHALALMAVAAVVQTLPATAAAATIYKCVDAQGRVVYQDKPCKPGSRQQRLHVADVPTQPASAPASASTVVMAPPAPPQTPPAIPAPVAAPPRPLYRCVDAVNGTPYISRRQPPPYLAPYAMLDPFQLPLSAVYGGRNGAQAGMSAPEFIPRAPPGMVGGYYTWTQDICRPLTIEETCAALRDKYEANQHKLRNAFDSDKPPLLKREAQLQRQLAGCR